MFPGELWRVGHVAVSVARRRKSAEGEGATLFRSLRDESRMRGGSNRRRTYTKETLGLRSGICLGTLTVRALCKYPH